MFRFLLILVGFFALYLSVVLVRSLFFLRQSGTLFKVSAAFPTRYFVGDPGKPAFTYLALGDSTVQGTGVNNYEETLVYKIAQNISKKGHYVEVINLGVSGARLKDLLDSQIPQIPSRHFDLITVSCGANDATHSTSLSLYETELRDIFQKLEVQKADHIFFATSPDLRLAPALPFPFSVYAGKRAAAQNSILTSLKTPVTLIDLYTEAKLKNRREYAADAFHPSGEGYQTWANVFTKTIL